MKNTFLYILAVCFSLMSFQALAFDEEQDKLYVKVDLGSNTFDSFDAGGTAVTSESKVGNLFTLSLGLQVNPIIGVEVSHNQFGTQDGTLVGGIPFENEISSNALSLVPAMPLGEKTKIFAELGQHIWDADTNVGGISSKADGSDLFYGFGFSYDIRSSLRSSFQFSKYEVDDDSFRSTAVSLAYLF